MNIVVQVALSLNTWSGFLSKFMLKDDVLSDKVYLQTFSANDQNMTKKLHVISYKRLKNIEWQYDVDITP